MMPAPEAIHADLARIADAAFPVAVAWHGAFLATGIAIAAGWRPSRRVAAGLLTLLPASVAGTSWRFASPFNAIAFSALAALLAALATRLHDRPLARGSAATTAAGAAMVAFGWSYPHFLDGRSWLAYLYGAPVGVVPCPTLSVAIGLTLLAGGLGSRAWSLALAAAGLFYGLFGALRLGVTIDLALAAGAAILLGSLCRGGLAIAGRHMSKLLAVYILWACTRPH